MLGYVEYNDTIYPYTEKDENGYKIITGLGKFSWVGERMCKEVDIDKACEPKSSLTSSVEDELAPRNEFETALLSVCKELYSTLVSKNRDYGDSYSKLKKEYGDLALIIRQSDKLERLKTLQKQDNLVNESTTDTKKDGAGYYILDLAYERVNTCSN